MFGLEADLDEPRLAARRLDARGFVVRGAGSGFGFGTRGRLRRVALVRRPLGFGALAGGLVLAGARHGFLGLIGSCALEFGLTRGFVLGRTGGGLCFERGALVHLAQDAAGALHRALVLGPGRDVLELVATRELFDGGDRGVLEFGVQRDAENLGAILEPLERVAPHTLVDRVSRKRPQHVHVGDTAHGVHGDRFPRRLARDSGERPPVGERAHGRQAVRLGDPFERFEGDVAQHRRGGAADRLVRVGLRQSHRSAGGSMSFATAARRTRASGSSRAKAASAARSSRGISWTYDRRTAGSGCVSRAGVRNRSSSVIPGSSLARPRRVSL